MWDDGSGLDCSCYGKLFWAEWEESVPTTQLVTTHCPGTLSIELLTAECLITVSNFPQTSPHLSALSLKHEEMTDAVMPHHTMTCTCTVPREKRNVRDSRSRLAHKSELHWYDNYYEQLVNYQTIAKQNEENCNLEPQVQNTSTRLFCCFCLMSAANRRKYE